MHARTRCLASLLFLGVALVAPAVRAAQAPVSAIATAGGRLAVAAGPVVRLFDEAGRPLLRLGPAEQPVGRSRQRSIRRLLEDNDLAPSDVGTNEAEELIDDELPLTGRHSPVPGPKNTALVMAAGDWLWAVVDGRAWAIPPDGPPRRGPAVEEAPDRMAVADGRLFVLAGSAVRVSRRADETPTALGASDGPIEKLVGNGPGTAVAWSSGCLVTVSSGGASARGRFDEPPSGLAFCGERRLAVVTAGRLWLGAPGGDWETHPLPPGMREVRCGPEGTPLVALGPGPLVSRDQGRTWQRQGPVGLSIDDVAFAPRGMWVLSSGTVTWLPDGDRAPGLNDLAPPDDGSLEVLATVRPSTPAWGRWLPTFTLGVSGRRVAGRQDVHGWALAGFPLDAPTWRAQAPAGDTSGATGPVPVVSARPTPHRPLADHEARCLGEAREAAVAATFAETERARSYVDRARRAGWLPELRVRVDRRLGRNESLDSPRTVSSNPLFGVDTVDDSRLEARLTWDLSRFVFSSEELAAQAQALRMAEARREIATLVNRLFFERRRLLHAESPLVEEGSSQERAERLEEIEAELDVLTRGAFGRCRGRREPLQEAAHS